MKIVIFRTITSNFYYAKSRPTTTHLVSNGRTSLDQTFTFAVKHKHSSKLKPLDLSDSLDMCLYLQFLVIDMCVFIFSSASLCMN